MGRRLDKFERMWGGRCIDNPGVETALQAVELIEGGVCFGAGELLGKAAIERVFENAAARLGSLDETFDESIQVRLTSSTIAESLSAGSRPAARNRRASRRTGRDDSRSIPSASRRRRAGSMVSTPVSSPAIAAAIPSAAAIVVLPTPPVPSTRSVAPC